MPEKTVNPKQLKAVRLIRAGSASNQVCKALRLRPDTVRSLEVACRNVPDDILACLEQALSANDKLRRLVAGLVQPASGMTGTDYD